MNLVRKFLEFIPVIIIFVGVLIFWELMVILLKVPVYILPAPSLIALKILSNKGLLLWYTAVTFSEALSGFLLGGLLGILIGIIFARFRFLERGFYPYAVAVKTIPIVAIAPLLILWFGNGLLPKIIISALVCFFPTLVNTITGLKTYDREAFELLYSLSASWSQIFIKLRFPCALPYIFSALKISSTLSVVGAIVGEFAGANEGLGFMILISSYRLETDVMFGAIVLCATLGISFFGIVALFEKFVLFWHRGKTSTM